MQPIPLTWPDSLTSRIAKAPPPGCWIFTGAIAGTGYGAVWKDGRLMSAHRASYEFFIGPIPEGLELDHLCRPGWQGRMTDEGGWDPDEAPPPHTDEQAKNANTQGE